MLGAMNCPDCGGLLRLVLVEQINAGIQEAALEMGNRIHNTFYRCDNCGGEFAEDCDDDSESSDHGEQADSW